MKLLAKGLLSFLGVKLNLSLYTKHLCGGREGNSNQIAEGDAQSIIVNLVITEIVINVT